MMMKMSDPVNTTPPPGSGRGGGSEHDQDGVAGARSPATASGSSGPTPGTPTSKVETSGEGAPQTPHVEPSWVRKVDPRIGQTFGKYRVEAVIGSFVGTPEEDDAGWSEFAVRAMAEHDDERL